MEITEREIKKQQSSYSKHYASVARKKISVHSWNQEQIQTLETCHLPKTSWDEKYVESVGPSLGE